MEILVVEDKPEFLRQEVKSLRDYGSEYYDLEIATAESVDEGLQHLEGAINRARPFDAVVLDYVLPTARGETEVESTRLAEFCKEHPACSKWVVQFTSFADDQALIDWWTRFSLDDVSVHLLPKTKLGFARLLESIYFREVKIPLRSEWLAAEVGEINSASGRPEEANGFNIYGFIRRLGDVWPQLDAQSRKRAAELFSIDLEEDERARPKRIGIKSFTHHNG